MFPDSAGVAVVSVPSVTTPIVKGITEEVTAPNCLPTAIAVAPDPEAAAAHVASMQTPKACPQNLS